MIQYARDQQTALKNLIINLFSKSLEGLGLTKQEIEDLRERHRWYHSNIYQLHQLKGKITSIQEKYDKSINEILEEIRREKEQVKRILYKALDRLETTMDKTIIKQYIDELIREFDNLLDNTAMLVLLGSIFGALGLFAIIAAIIAALAGSTVAGVATLGIGAVVGGTTSEVIFRIKLANLNENLADSINDVRSQEIQQLQQLDSYFDGFVQKLGQLSSVNSTINIVWFDRNIQNDANQSFADRLSCEFPSENYRVFQFVDETEVIQFVQTNIESDVILITSGSAGEAVISEIEYYCNIKGIIIFCLLVDDHQSWAGRYKKLLLVTRDSNEVIQKIKNIEHGDVYFLIHGFSLEDMPRNRTNIDYYLSTQEDGFIIQDLESINSNRSYHQNIIEQLHNKIVLKNIYPNGIPNHFELTNLSQFVDEFLEALTQTEPEKAIIALYTKAAPYYHRIINDILNRLDEELISLIADYIKALRYALIMYTDTTNTISNTTEMKLYRGLCLRHGNSLQEFQRKFQVTDVIILPSFSSTSLSKAKATSFTKGKGVLLEISADFTQVNKPKYISAESHYRNEEEVLLNCFSVLQVTSIKRISDNLVSYACILKSGIGN